jgi:myo-inositol-1(or 4)-monophosphatase
MIGEGFSVWKSGGLVATLDGGEYKQNGNIVAGTPRVFNELIDLLAPFLTPELRENTSPN